MNKYTSILAAILLAGASSTLTACGGSDDKPETKPDAGSKDAGAPSDDEETGPDDGADAKVDPDASVEEEGGKPITVDPSCLKNSHITDDKTNKICVIKAPKGNEITENLTLSPVKGYKGYLLSGVVYVGEDVGGAATPAAGKKSATLTITAGTTLAGADANSALAVNRGSKLEAVGTANDPVVFTSIKTLAGETGSQPTDWGGIVLMGRAPQNKGDNPVTELDTGTYGGVIADDNSGTIKYVRVEFSGSRSSMDKEFNGITFYAVGSKTTVDYVHIHAGSDDAVEFFGGTANASHLVVTGPGDDGIDWTDGWVGKIQFAVVQQYEAFGDNGIEADNQKGNVLKTPISEPTLANITLLGNNGVLTGDVKLDGMLFRVGSYGHIYSTLAMNFNHGCVSVLDKETVDAIGKGLTIESSRINCTPTFDILDAATSPQVLNGGSALFMGSASNKTLASQDVLENGFARDDTYNFLPKAGSDLLTGGTTPSDSFFQKVDFIGAFGTENWIKGKWVKITPFVPK